jgi:hypothetical protein
VFQRKRKLVKKGSVPAAQGRGDSARGMATRLPPPPLREILSTPSSSLLPPPLRRIIISTMLATTDYQRPAPRLLLGGVRAAS